MSRCKSLSAFSSASFADRAARLVHVSAGKEQQDSLAAKIAFDGDTLEAPTPRRDAVTLGERLQRDESNIVPVADVFRPWIAETDE